MERRNGAGFTVVELIITITVLVILTTLVVVRLSSTQASGRDQEREGDVTTLVTALEVFYQNGNAVKDIPKGYYPGGQDIINAAATTPPFHEFLEGVPQTTYVAPEQSTPSFGTSSTPAGMNTDGSYSDAQARTLLATIPYLYQPLQRSNAFCTTYTDCVKFNIYYLHEQTNTVITIRSKNQ